MNHLGFSLALSQLEEARQEITLHGMVRKKMEEKGMGLCDSGKGEPIVSCHGWPLSSDAWEDQMLFLAEQGYRCIAHDRRGHGRSSQPWT
jgi:pimeloyl-ACP methyl ester carboxylesterase